MAEPDAPLTWAQVLEQEFEALRGPLSADQRENIPRAIHQHPNPTSAVCLSGGGVRSATFALGVLQGLSHLGVLGKFDYLSTVSGGGYIGGWLSAWLLRSGPDGRDRALRALDPAQAQTVTGTIEAPPVDYLRRSCKYLAPSGGAMSADFWTLLATMARNLFLNWLVILPLLAAALLIPSISFGITESMEIVGTGDITGVACLTSSPWSMIWLGVTVVSLLTSFGYITLVFGGRGAAWNQNSFLMWCLTPMVIGVAAGANFWAAFPCDLNLAMMASVSAAIPVAGWFVLTRRGGWRTFIAAAVAGAVVGATVYAFDSSSAFAGLNSVRHAALYALLAVPCGLGSILVAIAVFTGLASHDLDDAALEWWSRCAAWIGLATVAWLVAGVLVFYLAGALQAAVHSMMDAANLDRRWTTTILSALVPLLGSLAGIVGRKPGGDGKPSTVAVVLQALIMPVVILGLLTSLAWVNLRLVGSIEYHTYTTELGPTAPCPTELGALTGTVEVHNGVKRGCHTPGAGLGEIVLLLAGYVAVGIFMSYFVPVNRFSLHGMYRQRIVRTFLGASRADRVPNAFTGFDGNDDLRIAELRDVRPLHVVCATLNAVKSTRVGRHERQSQSFTFSALHAGNREVGYRPAAGYGADTGKPNSGLSLGTALTVSGAAASSAMGMYSSKGRAFLLTLANARLGLWFGNPASATGWRTSEPPLGVDPIARELLGLTTDDNPFVYLSDGGHYENLGLWEMVARRCRVIVVSDAGADPGYTFDSLSIAIRRIRLDLGIPIEFGSLGITKEGELRGNAHGAVGVIRYSVVDGKDAPDGTIVFLRAALSGDEPVDILTYAKTDPEFPNDPTSDQFFDEARFESYRLLGFHTVLNAFQGFEAGGSIANLCAAARQTYPST